MLSQDSLRSYEARCTQESPPACRRYCPFDLDGRSLMRLVAQGDIAAARTLLLRHLPLPHLLSQICDHPCEEACLRRDYGGSLAIRDMARFCLAYPVPEKRTLPLPPKRHAMAILGSGLTALTAAWDLAGKNYPVTLFAEGNVDDLLKSHPLWQSQDVRDALAKDLAKLLQKQIEVRPLAAKPDLAELSSAFDAILIDAYALGDRLTLPGASDIDQETLFWHDSICVAGWLSTSPTGHSYLLPSQAASQGRIAAQSMERLAQGLSLTAERKKDQAPLHTDPGKVALAARIEPSAATYSLEEAQAEAKRCLDCQCLRCVRACSYLQQYQGYPRLYARQIHNNATIVKGLHQANALINGCTLCGQCAELCPEHFSMADLCLAAREDMVAAKRMPARAHEFALEDMQNACENAVFLPDQDVSKPSWVFFPGCQLAAERPSQVLELYDILRTQLNGGPLPGVALAITCCGMPAHWAGQKALFSKHMERLRAHLEELGRPKLMTACASCLAAFTEALPDYPLCSVWEVLDTFDISALQSSAKARSDLPKTFSLHDPCTASHNPAWQKAVRSLIQKTGASFCEPEHSGTTTSCCGYGGLVACAQPDTADGLARQRIAELTEPALASCIICRDRFARLGKACWHILDLLLPKEGMSGECLGSGLSEHRTRRAKLRREVLARMGKEESCPEEGIALAISPELLDDLERRHILRNDLTEAVAFAEAHQTYFLNSENDHRLGSFRPRNVTFWVEYSLDEHGFVLHAAWCHRMIVPGSGGRPANEVIDEQQALQKDAANVGGAQ